MNITKFKLKITLLDQLLGTVAYDKEVYETFVQKKARDEGVPEEQLEQEIASIETIEEKGWTGFFRDEKGLWISSHMIKGYLKNAALVMKEQTKVKNAKSKVNNFVFVFPKKLHLGKEKADGMLERPLRCETMKGPRVSLARSDYIDAGTTFECEIHLMQNPEVSEKYLREILDYGKYMGLGQWRNSGKGQFEYELEAI
jgi:hypothetical protein